MTHAIGEGLYEELARVKRERDEAAKALIDIRIVTERVGWDRGERDANEYANRRAIETLKAIGYDAYASSLERRAPSPEKTEGK